MLRRKWMGWIMAGLMAVLGGGLPTAGSLAATPVTVKVAYVPTVLFAPLLVAQSKGYFRQEGINLDLTTVPAGQDAMVFVANGQLDAAVVGISAGFYNDVASGLNVRIVAPMGVIPVKGNPSPLMVRTKLYTSGAVHNVKELKGHRIGIAGGMGSTGSYMLAALLKTVGLTLKDVTVVNMSFPEMVTAMANGSIDAAIPPQPFSNAILKAKSGVILGKVGTNLDLTGVVFGGRFMRTEPAVARRFMVALLKGVRAVQGANYGGAANMNILAKDTKLPLSTLQGMDSYAFSPNLSFNLSTLRDMQKVYAASGLLSYKGILGPNRLADFNYAHAAVKALGRYSAKK